MKLILLAFFAAVICVQCRPNTAPVRHVGKIEDNVKNYIIREGYHARIYTVQTEDGYLLDLVRIPHQRQQLTKNVEEYSTSTEDSQENQRKPAVLLMPGMMSTYEDFVIGGHSQGLAFVLADAGYDVYMGNVRGSFYGQKHTTLDPERDEAFWRHSFHEIGVKDLPAIIDKVIAISGQDRIDYVGHMEGSTIFYVMASERQEYNHKINRMVSLGPVAFMKHSKNVFFRELDSRIVNQEIQILQNTERHSSAVWNSGWMMRFVGKNTYGMSQEMMNAVEAKCEVDAHYKEVCENYWFLINGFNSQNYNMTTVERYMPRSPSPVSSRQILHFVQLMISGRFQKYNETFDRHHAVEREYDLSKVTAKMSIFYTPEDTWSQEEDVQRLIQQLPNVIHTRKVEHLTNNVDFIFSQNVVDRVYRSVVETFRHEDHMVHTPLRKMKLDDIRMD